MRSVPHQAQLIVMTNSGSGYGYARGADAAGTIQCPTNFHSIREFLRHMACHLPCLCENPSIFILYKNKGSLNEADYILQLSRIKRCYWRWSVGDTTRRQCLAIQWPNPGTASSILPTWSKFHPAVYCPANSLTSSALPSLLQLAIMNTLASATCNPLWVQNTSYWTLGRIWFWIVFM